MDSDLPNCKTIKIYICPGCENKVKLTKVMIPSGPFKGQEQEMIIGCDCEILGIVKKEQQNAKRERVKRIFEANSLINPSLQNACFENFERDEFKQACIKAWKYAQTFDLNHPKNLFFQGSFGTGKSHLSVSIAKELIKRGYSTIFISAPKLLTKIRSTYNKNSEFGEEQLIQTIADADLVVFDDIGAEGNIQGWGMQKIFEVIDHRSGKSSIFSTNLSSAEFEVSMDHKRIFSRMMMNTEAIVMNGTDYRRRNFMKKVK